MALIAAFLGFVFLEYGSLLCMARGNVHHYDFVVSVLVPTQTASVSQGTFELLTHAYITRNAWDNEGFSSVVCCCCS